MVEITKEGQIQIKDAQGDWTNGAKQSLANYADYAGNVASQTASMFQDGFRNMEDAVTNFAMTGKLNFHNFAEGVISDLIRIYIRQQMVGMVGSCRVLRWRITCHWQCRWFSIPPDLSNPLGGFTFSAKGNAFSGGSVTAFAKGGAFGNSIVDTPTMAPMAVFGEAGQRQSCHSSVA
jgi:phage-related minor tail protein